MSTVAVLADRFRTCWCSPCFNEIADAPRLSTHSITIPRTVRYGKSAKTSPTIPIKISTIVSAPSTAATPAPATSTPVSTPAAAPAPSATVSPASTAPAPTAAPVASSEPSAAVAAPAAPSASSSGGMIGGGTAPPPCDEPVGDSSSYSDWGGAFPDGCCTLSSS